MAQAGTGRASPQLPRVKGTELGDWWGWGFREPPPG